MTYSSFTTVVTVWDKPYEITAIQRSKSAWIVVGEYMGERLEVTGRSSSQAVKAWQEAARYRGN